MKRERYSGYILLPVDPNGSTLPSSKLKVEGPHCFKFLASFFDDLIDRKALPYGSKLTPFKKYRSDKRKAASWFQRFN